MKKIKSFKFLIIFVTGFICGFVFGSSAINALISYRVDAYIEKIKYLESDIEEKNIKLEKYQESINNRKFILRSIELNIKLSKVNEEEFDLILVEKSIKEKYKELLGK